jgi:hypothetical protein
MTAPKRTLLAQDINGQAEVTLAGAAILLGVTLEALTAHCDPIATLAGLPKEWRQLAQRRAREGQAATGAQEVGPVLMYWATQMFGEAADFDFDEPTNSLWMITAAPPGRLGSDE